MKKIIGFDSWTIGAHHFARLVPAFRKRGCELLLIHVGSWGHDKNRPLEEEIGGLSVRDISYYDGLSFKDILIKEAPSAVLFLSTRAFTHLTFNIYAKLIGIPSCHLYHGLVNVQPVEISGSIYKTNWKSQLMIIQTRLMKNLFMILPKYIKALVETRASYAQWHYLISDIIGKITAQYPQVASPDATTTIGCVYTQADVTHMINTYRMPQDKVYVVGNPDLDYFNFNSENLGMCVNNKRTSIKDIIYIDTALIDVGVIYDGEKDFIDHLIMTQVELKKQGLNLILKPHPAHIRTGIIEHIKGIGIEICENEEFVSRLEKTTAAIVEPSTAAMIPGLMGLPLFLAKYGKLKDQAYGKVLTSYPRARHLNDLKEISKLISDIKSANDNQSVLKWINENSGPLPAGDMPDRVAEAVMKVISDLLPKKHEGRESALTLTIARGSRT